MLLAAIDENHRGTYDFLYLPIDFKVITFRKTFIWCYKHNLFKLNVLMAELLWLQNKCNVGYAFINMVSPACIISFYEVGFGILIAVLNNQIIYTFMSSMW
jgi:hypothetical protein